MVRVAGGAFGGVVQGLPDLSVNLVYPVHGYVRRTFAGIDDLCPEV